MSSVANGTYRLYNVGTGKYMDVLDNSAKDGTYIVINPLNAQGDSQIFVVSTYSGTKRRIKNRLSSKHVSCATTQAYITIESNNLMQWDFEDSGNTVNINGISYPTFYLRAYNSSGNRWSDSNALGPNDSADRTYVRMLSSSARTGRKDEWAFVPVQKFESGRLYEIRSMLIPKSLTLDIYKSNPANGANLQVYGVNHTNNQKFYITEEETGKYSIRCFHSGKYIDVAGGLAVSGTNVQAWEDNDTRAQRWNIIPYGTTTINGIECLVVRFGSFITATGTTWMMDVMTDLDEYSWETNVQIYEYIQNNDAQLFALLPTEGEDPTMPVPYDFGVKNSINGTAWNYTESDIRLGWKCAKSWAGDGSNNYQIRSRKRLMNSTTSAWKNWSDWTAWEVPNVTTQGVKVYSNDIEEITYEWDGYKNCEIEYQLRAAAAENANVLHGKFIDKVINSYKKPDIAITEAGWTPLGLSLGLSSDYTYGTSMATVTKIINAETGKQLYRGKYTLEFSKATGSGVIPNRLLKAFPEDGDNLAITYRVGYDQHENFTQIDASTNTVAVAYESGNVDVTPQLIQVGRRLFAVVPQLGEEHVWVSFEDVLYECSITEDYTAPSGYVAFDVMFPMGIDFQVFTEAHNSDRTRWGTDVTDVNELDIYCHAFNWNGKSIFIDKFGEGGEQFGLTVDADYSADILDSRRYESVSFNATKQKHIAVNGIVVKGEYAMYELEELVGEHVYYRSPEGGLFEVAVTDFSATLHNDYYEVSFDLIVETR